MSKQTVVLGENLAGGETDWDCGNDYIVATAAFDTIVNYDADKDTVDIDTAKLRQFMQVGQAVRGSSYFIGTMLPMRACRGLHHYNYWPLLANQWELDLDVVFVTVKDGKWCELHRDGYGWSDYYDQRRVFIFAKEFFDCFGEGKEGWLKGWKWVFENKLINGDVPDSFDLTKVDEVLENATRRLNDVVWVEETTTEPRQLAAAYYKMADAY